MHFVIIDRTVQHKPPAGFLDVVKDALTIQAIRFCWDWALDHAITVTVGPVVPDAIPIYLKDTSDVEGALGYHDRNRSQRPEIFVFAGTILDNHGSWSVGASSVSVCMSHEVLETLLDLAANQYDFDERAAGPLLWAREACDAVESSSYGTAGVAVSDYVLPPYFTPGARGPYDRLGVLRYQFSIDRGGYAIVMKAGAQSQKFGDGFTVHPDPAGNLALVVGPDYPAWKRDIKAPATTRTMQRLFSMQV